MKKLLRRIFPTKEMREYNKMYKKHRKTMIKLAKDDADWDWCFLHKMVMTKIKHMYEYYSAGNNVWQDDETRLPIIEQLKHILDISEEINQMRDNSCDIEYVHKDGVCTAVFPDDFKERIYNSDKKEQELYEELYSSIGKNLRWWWD